MHTKSNLMYLKKGKLTAHLPAHVSFLNFVFHFPFLEKNNTTYKIHN
jgi:hypothetical protein